MRRRKNVGVAELVELDGPFVKISLKGRFWHKRSTVLDRLANYLKQRIPVSPLILILYLYAYLMENSNFMSWVEHFRRFESMALGFMRRLSRCDLPLD